MRTNVYRAGIIEPMADWGRNGVRLVVMSADGAVLMGDGTWHVLAEGEATGDDAGLPLPREAIDAILTAIEQWQGRANHGATEARVLREWLGVERARVDKTLGIGREGA
jgi:hypothetical protein